MRRSTLLLFGLFLVLLILGSGIVVSVNVDQDCNDEYTAVYLDYFTCSNSGCLQLDGCRCDEYYTGTWYIRPLEGIPQPCDGLCYLSPSDYYDNPLECEQYIDSRTNARNCCRCVEITAGYSCIGKFIGEAPPRICDGRASGTYCEGNNLIECLAGSVYSMTYCEGGCIFGDGDAECDLSTNCPNWELEAGEECDYDIVAEGFDTNYAPWWVLDNVEEIHGEENCTMAGSFLDVDANEWINTSFWTGEYCIINRPVCVACKFSDFYCGDGVCNSEHGEDATYCPADCSSCVDSDGFDFLTLGTVDWVFEGVSETETDFCIGNTLTEWYCNATTFEKEFIEEPCALECNEGACTCDCEDQSKCAYQKTGYTGDEIYPESNDWPTRIDDVNINDCCNQGECVLSVSGFTSCKAENVERELDGETFICDEGMWVDLDTTEFNCEDDTANTGFKWLPGGLRNTNYGSSTVVIKGEATSPYVGEYDELFEMECCGDDDLEYIVGNEATDFCPNDETKKITCCPSGSVDGKDYKIINGECVLECPFIEKTAKVLVDAPITNFLELSQQFKAAMGSTEYGCYPPDNINCPLFMVDIQPINIPIPVPKAFCSEDPSCVFASKQKEDSSTDTTRGIIEGTCEEAKLCFEGTVCKERVSELPFSPEDELILYDEYATMSPMEFISYNSNEFTITTKIKECYKIPPLGCIPVNCAAKSISKIASGACFPACLREGSTAGDCILACTNVRVQYYTYYDGPGCTFEGVCNDPLLPWTNVCVEEYSISDYNPLVQKDSGIDEEEIIIIKDYYTLTTTCTEEEYCDDLGCVEDAICVEPTTYSIPQDKEVTQLLHVHDYFGEEYGVLQCDSDTGVMTELGDFWCPEGFEADYNDENEWVCIADQDVCASGFTGHISPECEWSKMFTTDNDLLWGLYAADCVYNEADSLQYLQTCCLDSVFNDYNVYSETYVVVY